jgi:hypothetical protein
MSFWPRMKTPSAFRPVAMSLDALALVLVLGVVAIFAPVFFLQLYARCRPEPAGSI